VLTRGEDRYVAWWSVSKTTRIREWLPPEGCNVWRFAPDGRYAALTMTGQRIAIIRMPGPFEAP
jgi:hypothetical protein